MIAGEIGISYTSDDDIVGVLSELLDKGKT